MVCQGMNNTYSKIKDMKMTTTVHFGSLHSCEDHPNAWKKRAKAPFLLTNMLLPSTKTSGASEGTVYLLYFLARIFLLTLA